MPIGHAYFAECQLRARTEGDTVPWRPTFSAERSMKRHGWAVPEEELLPKPAKEAGGDAPSAAEESVEAKPREARPTRRTRQRRDELCAPEAVPEAVEQTMFFLDWDDTLLPTTHLRSASCITSSGGIVGVPPPSLQVQLLALEREVCDLLASLQEQPNAVVCIVTNASAGWVQSSAAEFMPAVAAAVKSRQIRVRNARTAVGTTHGTSAKVKGSGVLNPARWKADVFWEELAPLRWSTPGSPSPAPSPQDFRVDAESLQEQPVFKHCEPQPVRIVSIGDSQWERTAASVVGRQGDVVVTVKLAANPSCAALRQQLRRIRQAATQLRSAKQSASINAVAQRNSKKPAKPASAPQPHNSTAIAA